jgi:glutathione peroxidase
MKTIDGADQPLSAYAGKVVLIVNVASFCGYTKQYAPLEKLYRTYKDRGLVILGFPANDFGAQEPGTEEEIKEFCSTKFDVTFPMFAKITVKGPDKHPLYAWLTSGGGNASLAGEVAWNFEKFLIGKDGAIVGRFTSKVDPMSAELVSAVEAALAK